MTATTCHSTAVGNHHDDEYDAFLSRLQQRFLQNCDNGAQPLFTTDVNNLWDLYLEGFADPVERQYHDCRTCRQFIERFGGLVTIDQDGRTAPAFWDVLDAPTAYLESIAAMARTVRRSTVTGVFRSSCATWGTPETAPWRHLAITPPASMVFRNLWQSAGQAMAEKREDFGTVSRALAEWRLPHLETALRLLRSDALYRSEKVLGQAEWLHQLQVARKGALGRRKANLVWRAVATAPAGFCHPRSSMIGTLLIDIASGKSFEAVSRAFAAKMHPLSYQRPKAPPTAGTIAAAEKLVEQLGVAGALARRFARVDELLPVWRPMPAKPQTATGVFSHLVPKRHRAQPIDAPAQVMTWEKFSRTVLPHAERIELLTPSRGSYCALVTAVNADAPPILQWDSERARNPVSWYLWNGGSTAAQFNLPSSCFVEVEVITPQPSMWHGGESQGHHGAGVIFVLAGARETRDGGAGLFPEILKAEFHGIRSVIEAYSRNGSVEGLGQPHAAGVLLQAGMPWDCKLRVWSSGQSMEYRLDRWD